jgi:hypothetical protein
MTEESRSKSSNNIAVSANASVINHSTSLPLDCSKAVTGVWLVKVLFALIRIFFYL